jgi:hypothetical protein
VGPVDRRAINVRFSLHGLGIELSCQHAPIGHEILRVLGDFSVTDWPANTSPTTGVIRPYESEDVLKHVSPTAVPIQSPDDLIELYQEDERFWLIDERWGMCELNLLKSQWRSWLLPHPSLDAVRCAEMAVVWPLAQLLAPRGLHLVPAASIARDGWGVLILCPFGIGPELTALAREGYRIVGQGWTALREEDGRVAMLRVPGQVEVERIASDRLRLTEALRTHWSDLTMEYPGSALHHAFCDTVLIVEPGRRSHAASGEMSSEHAAAHLRRAWPLRELHPHRRRHARMPMKLAGACRCHLLQLSQTPQDLIPLLDSIRGAWRSMRGQTDAAASPDVLRLPLGHRLPGQPRHPQQPSISLTPWRTVSA